MTPAQHHMGRVASLGCIACRLLGFPESPAQVHHIREGRIARCDWLTIPLCPPHHTGKVPGVPSVHNEKDALLRALGIFSEFDLLALVIKDLAPKPR
jgi:hypothetical protein